MTHVCCFLLIFLYGFLLLNGVCSGLFSELNVLRQRLRSLLRVRLLQQEIVLLLTTVEERRRQTTALQQPFFSYATDAASDTACITQSQSGGRVSSLLQLTASAEERWQV